MIKKIHLCILFSLKFIVEAQSLTLTASFDEKCGLDNLIELHQDYHNNLPSDFCFVVNQSNLHNFEPDTTTLILNMSGNICFRNGILYKMNVSPSSLTMECLNYLSTHYCADESYTVLTDVTFFHDNTEFTVSDVISEKTTLDIGKRFFNPCNMNVYSHKISIKGALSVTYGKYANEQRVISSKDISQSWTPSTLEITLIVISSGLSLLVIGLLIGLRRVKSIPTTVDQPQNEVILTPDVTTPRRTETFGFINHTSNDDIKLDDQDVTVD
jgi:hypothetical protein